MALILNEKYVGAGSYRTFILSRFYRIFPAYWIILLTALLFSLIGYFFFNNAFYLSHFISNKECLSIMTICYFIFENIVIIGQDLLYFLRLDEWCNPKFTYAVLSYKHTGYQYLLIPQAWSISLELLFYSIAPFIVRRKLRWQLAIVILFLVIKVIYALQFNLSFDPWTYRFFPFEISFFILGSIAYQSYKYFLKKDVSPKVGYTLLVLCLFSVLIVREITWQENYRNLLFYALIFCSIPFIFITFKDNTIDRYIGELSFSIYISHHLIVSIFRVYFYKHYYWIPYYGYSILIASIIFAIIFHKAILKPLELRRVKRFS